MSTAGTTAPGPLCARTGCTVPAKARGLCGQHYSQLMRALKRKKARDIAFLPGARDDT